MSFKPTKVNTSIQFVFDKHVVCEKCWIQMSPCNSYVHAGCIFSMWVFISYFLLTSAVSECLQDWLISANEQFAQWGVTTQALWRELHSGPIMQWASEREKEREGEESGREGDWNTIPHRRTYTGTESWALLQHTHTHSYTHCWLWNNRIRDICR